MNTDLDPPSAQHVVMGLWPIAGVTTHGVTEQAALETIETALEIGIRTFDTAYSYGLAGESDRYLARFLKSRDDLNVIGKVGQRWDSAGVRVVDCSAKTLRSDAEESLQRLGIPQFSLLMLHQVDPAVAVQTSAAAFREMWEDGLAARVGLCNATSQQRQAFSSECPCHAIQCPLNVLQIDSLDQEIADAYANGIETYVYWTLMKGLLAGKIRRDHQFQPGDSRPNYAIFQGEARDRAHDFVDQFRTIANDMNMSVAALSVSWAISQPGVTSALVGARYPDQIREMAPVRTLDSEILNRIDAIR